MLSSSNLVAEINMHLKFSLLSAIFNVALYLIMLFLALGVFIVRIFQIMITLVQYWPFSISVMFASFMYFEPHEL